MRLPVWLLAAVLISRPLSAQVLRGNATLAGTERPAAGVVIEAVLESDVTVRMRTLVGSSGRYVLQLPRAGTYRLQGLRIGYVPTPFGSITMAAGETQTRDLVLATTAVQLTVVRVDTRAVCGRNVPGGSTVAALLSQVRTALDASTLVSTDGRAQAEVKTYRLIVDHRRVPLAGPWDSVRTGATQRPFASASPMVLSNEGFVRVSDDAVVFRAPDADVLLSEWFLSTHCYAVEEDRDRPDLIGLRFTPARVRSNVTDIRGTLWLTREGTKLQWLEFGYVGLPRYLAATNPGGTLSFAQLSDGSWIVRSWELRMPRPVRAFALAGQEGEVPMIVASTEFRGGHVSKVQRDSVVLFEAEEEALAARFPALADSTARASCPSTIARDAATRGLVYGFISARSGSLPNNTRAEISWRAPPHPTLSENDRKQFRVLDAPDGFFMLCGLPYGSTITVQALAPGLTANPIDVRLGDRQPSARMTILLEPEPTRP